MPFRDPRTEPRKEAGRASKIRAISSDSEDEEEGENVTVKRDRKGHMRYFRGGKRISKADADADAAAKAKGKAKTKTKAKAKAKVKAKAKAKAKGKGKSKKKKEEEEEESEEEEEEKDNDKAWRTEADDLNGKTMDEAARDLDLIYDENSLRDPQQKLMKVNPSTYVVCTEISDAEAGAVQKDLLKQAPYYTYKGKNEGLKRRLKSQLQEQTEDPGTDRKDRPFYGKAPHLVKALTYQMCKEKFWPKSKFEQPFKKYTRLPTSYESFVAGQNLIRSGVRGLAPTLVDEISTIVRSEERVAESDED